MNRKRLPKKETTTPNYITPAGAARLQAEFDELFKVERPQVVQTVSWAAGNGDRSENGDYIYGKKRLREIDSRLRYLGKQLERAKIIDPKEVESDRIVFGATVQFVDTEGEEYEWQIVGEDEVDPEQGKISWKSPVARALLGKQEGDETKLKRPKGDLLVEIVSIRFK